MTPTTNNVETLQTQVDQVAKDLADLKKLTDESLKQTKAEAAADKLKTAKEAINKKIEALKGLTDATSKADVLKLEAMLKTLESSDTELETLKAGIVADKNITTPAEEKTEVPTTTTTETTEENPEEKKNRLKRQRDGLSDSTEENHALKNTARLVWWAAAAYLVYRGIKSLFGRGKKKEKKEAKDGEDNDGEEKGFWEKPFGKILKWTGIGTWAYYLIHGLKTGRWSIRDFFDRSNKAWYESNDPKKFDEVYEKESKEKQVKHEELWKAVNEFFTAVYGSEVWAWWSDMLWENSGDDKFDSHIWTMPAVLDDGTKDVWDILDGTSDFGKKLDEFWAKISKDVGKQVNPLNWFSGSGASEEDLAKLDKEDQWKYQAYRKTLKVQVFLHQKEKVLIRRLVAEKLGITDYATASETVKKTYDEKIDEAMDDDATMNAVQTKMESVYYNQKLTGVMAVLKKYNITNDEMAPDTKASLIEIDQDKNDLIWDTLDRATASSDINADTTLKSDLEEVCTDFDEKINDEDNQLVDFNNFFIGLWDAWLNMEAWDKQEVLKEIWYTEKIWAYSTKILSIKEKIKNGTATKADMIDLKKTIDDYYMFKKDIMLGISFVHEADDKGTGIGRTLLYIWGKLLGVIEWIYDAAWWGIVWFAVAWVATIWGAYVAGKIIKWWVKKTVTGWLDWCKWITKDPGKVLIGRRFYRHIRYGQESKIMQAIRRQSYKWDKWYTRFSEDFLDGKISSQEAKKIIVLNQKNWTKNQYWTGANVEDMLKKWGFIIESDTRANKLLITTYFDQNKNFRKAVADPKLRSKVLISVAEYDTKLKSLITTWETKKVKFLEEIFTYARFKDGDELLGVIKNIDDAKLNLSTLDEKQITNLAKKLGRKISNKTTIDEIVASISEVNNVTNTATDVLKNLSVEQKKVYDLIADDISQLTKANESLKKVPGYVAGNATEVSNKAKIVKMEDWQLKLKNFDASELDAFAALRKFEFKSNHIIEIFELKKVAAVEKELKKLENGAADVSGLLRQLKSSKAAWADISESLIKTLDDIHTKNLLKSADEVAEFAKDLFKIIAKIS